jgi:hypothetical protein
MKITNSFGTKFRGALGKDIIASSWRGIRYIRAYTKPRDPKSGRQLERRGTFAEAVHAWQELPPEEQKKYERRARGMSGYNLFISLYVRKRLKAPRDAKR